MIWVNHGEPISNCTRMHSCAATLEISNSYISQNLHASDWWPKTSAPSVWWCKFSMIVKNSSMISKDKMPLWNLQVSVWVCCVLIHLKPLETFAETHCGKKNGRNMSAQNKLPIALIQFTYKLTTHWSPGMGDSKTFHAPYDWGNDLPMRTMEMFDYNWSLYCICQNCASAYAITLTADPKTLDSFLHAMPFHNKSSQNFPNFVNLWVHDSLSLSL